MTENLCAVVNATGFPLQAAVEAVARRREHDHHWQVLAREHFWSTPEASARFLDLVLGGQDYNADHSVSRLRLVIECKRLDGPLVFLQSDLPPRRRGQVRVHYSCPRSAPAPVWRSFGFSADGPTVEFCAPGTRKGQRIDQPSSRMLEPWCSELLAASCALAAQELPSLRTVRSEIVGAAYVPVLVTTASLHLLSYDPSAVDLATGHIPAPSAAALREVPWVHFQKDFGLERPGDAPLDPETFESRARQSVLVVRASAFDAFLDTAHSLRIP